MTRIVHNSRRSRTSCSILALATVLAVGATPVAATSLQGSGVIQTNTGGVAGIDQSVLNQTNVTLNPGNTVINWTPTDNIANPGVQINFQNAGTTATFSSSGDFAVLNNINVADTSRVIAMNGTVTGKVAGSTGGSIYFYSPSGFLIGNNAIFNMSSLVLSALPITNASFANVGNNGYGQIVFGQAPNPNASITMNGTVNAFIPPPVGFPGPGGNGYMAMVAPKVVQGASSVITANGSAALVAAEAATITFSSDMLFDIQVDVGTTSTTGVEVNGRIGGSTPTGVSDQQRIFLVAVPKNDALTMAIGSGADLGFTLANTAVDDNGVIVLSAGYDVVDGAIAGESNGDDGTSSAGINFGGARARNNVVAKATGDVDIYSDASHLTTLFNNDLTVDALGEISIGADTLGASLNVAGNLDLSTSKTGTAGQSVTAADMHLYSNHGAVVTVAGSTTLSADGTGGNAAAGTAGSGTGGTIWVNADNGSSLTTQSINASAKGTGGNGTAAGVNAGNGTGGTFRLYSDTDANVLVGAVVADVKGTGGDATGAGVAGNGKGGNAYVYIGDDAALTINGTTGLFSDGQGGSHDSGTGGNGTGGESRVTAVVLGTGAGQLTFNGDVVLSSDGFGGGSLTGAGGVGTGGWARISTPFDHNVDLNGSADLHANGSGGFGGTIGGLGKGGTADIAGIIGDIDISGTVDLNANGDGGDADAGGAGTGGNINITSGSTVTVHNYVHANANGNGGEAFSGNGGIGQGGIIHVTADDGSLSINYLEATADGMGGQAQNGGTVSGNGEGGDVYIQSLANGSLSITDGLGASANGTGGQVGYQVSSGSGSGGYIEVTASGTNSTLHVGGDVGLSADGSGGFEIGDCFVCGGLGGDGFGGDIYVKATGSTASVDIDGSLWATADGYGGFGVDADGGYGEGGFIQLAALDGGSVDVAGDFNADADGEGGTEGGYLGDLTARGGDGLGGAIEILTAGSGTPNLHIGGSANMTVEGHGGGIDPTTFGEMNGVGGTGTGGSVGIYGNAGLIDIDGSLYGSADGYGGDATYFYGGALGDGGDGFGNLAELSVTGGAIQVGGSANLSASGYGGDGINGGKGTGGGDVAVNNDGAHITARNGTITLGSASLYAAGYGGDGDNSGFETAGGNGGDGQGGFSSIFAANSDSGPSFITITGVESSAYVSSDGFGGRGGDGGGGNTGGDGGHGGDGTGGWSSILAAAGNGHVTVDLASLSAQGWGGDGGDGGNGDGGAGGNGGLGGNATGGGINVGTASGLQAASSNLGVATFGGIYADASATGGQGGDGNFGASDGNGGDGGEADGGHSVLLVRGSTVNANGTTTLVASGTGGDGGLGGGTTGIGGDGGDGIAGEVGVLVTSRYLLATQRGTLNADIIDGTAEGIGGAAAAGGTDGTGIVEGGSNFDIDSSTVNIDSLSFTVSGDAVAPGSDPSRISIKNNSPVTVGDFSHSTIGELSLYVPDNVFTVSNTLTLAAANFVYDPDNPVPSGVGLIDADTVNVTTDDDFVANANWDVTNTFVVDAPGLIALDNIHDDNGIDFSAGGSISLGGLIAGTYVDLLAGGDINMGNITAGSSVRAETTGGFIDVGNIGANSFVTLIADTFILGEDIITGGDIFAQTTSGNLRLEKLTSTFGAITVYAGNDLNITSDALADGDIDLTASGNIDVKNLVSGEQIDIDSLGDVLTLDLTAGNSIEIAADGAVDVGNLSAGLIDQSIDPDADFTIGIHAGVSIAAGDVSAFQHIGLASPGTITTGDIDAGGIFLALGHGDMSFGDVNADSETYLADYSMVGLGGDLPDEFDPAPILASAPTPTGGSISMGNVTTGKFTAAAGTNLTVGVLNADGGISLDAGAAITTGDLTVGDFVLANGGSITTGDIDSFSVDMTSTAGNITTGDVFAFGDVSMDAAGDILTGDINAGSIDLFAGDDITTGDLTTNSPPVFLLAGGITTLLFPGASITLESGGDISTGNIDSIDGVYASAGGSITTLAVEAVDFVDMAAQGNISTGAIDAGDYVFLESTGGAISTGNITGTDVELDAGGNIGFATVNADDLDFSAGGSVNGGNIIVDNRVSGDAAGTVTLLNITAGPSIPVDDFSVGIAALGNISVGNVTAPGPVGFATSGNLTTGNLSSGNLVMTLVGGNITTGSIATTDEFGQVYMGDDSIFLANGGTLDGDGDFDALAALEDFPTATGGSITINGPVSTGLFRAAAGAGLTTQAITAGDILASAGGTATINGIWNSSDEVELRSNNIDITGTGGINAGGYITLASSNSTQMLVGDGLTSSGYVLSNAEFGRISGEQIQLVGRGDASAAVDLVVGDLTVTGPLVGSNIEGADGALVFAVGDIGTLTPGGVIRVFGNVNATGFGSGNAIEFYADRFELDAARGSVSITSTGGALSGELGLYAPRIHVAQASILDALATNPTYAGYQDDLNLAATTQRPDGVLRADTIWIESDNLQDVLIQNTGTYGQNAAPAGFLARQIFVNDDFEVAGPPGSINIVVNGQLVGEGGTLTGVAVRDALVPEGTDITPFTSNSTINACPLTGVCVIRPPVPPTPNVVDSQIDLITGDNLGDSDFGNEDAIDDNEEGDEGANNPIAPPQPLFDTRPLIPGGDVNDPVSGTGNPALLGSDAECESGENGQCPNPANGDGQ